MKRLDRRASTFDTTYSSRNAHHVRRLRGLLDCDMDRLMDLLLEGQLSDEEIGSPVFDRRLRHYFPGLYRMDDAGQAPTVFCRRADRDHVSELPQHPILR